MSIHVPVMADEVARLLLDGAARDSCFVDCTFGGGGHSRLALERGLRVIALDRDRNAVTAGQEEFSSWVASGRLQLHEARFSQLGRILRGQSVSVIFADLGYSSDQLQDAGRGLSFLEDGPLDMRLGPQAGESCHEKLLRVAEAELARVLFEYGEERFARRIARRLCEMRIAGQLPRTTRELASAVVSAYPAPARHGRIHAATKSFQALRIWVNDELAELEALLSEAPKFLAAEGRFGVISFHSLEDRKVKRCFVELARAGRAELLTRKPLIATPAEIARNPRSRSAKLRGIRQPGSPQVTRQPGT